MKRNFLIKGGILLFTISLLAGCTSKTDLEGDTDGIQATADNTVDKVDEGEMMQQEAIEYYVEPETFSLDIIKDGTLIPVSLPVNEKRTEGLIQKDKETRWSYPEEQVNVAIRPQAGYLEVSITSDITTDNEFTWPQIAGDTYYLPFGEGKRIPADDTVWAEYLSGQDFNVLEQLSMPFWASVQGRYAVIFILENPYRNTLNFDEDKQVTFSLSHSYPEIDEQKDNRFRIYVTDNSPAAVAKVYRDYVKEQGRLVTLAEKVGDNPNIEKLYGAPHIYMAGDFLIAPEDINWPSFRQALSSDVMNYILAAGDGLETGNEMRTVIKEISSEEYVNQYQKQVICRYLTEVLRQEDFFNESVFTRNDNYMESASGLDGIGGVIPGEGDPAALLQWNKHALAANLPDVFKPAETWMDSLTVDLINDLKASGIEQAWIGLHSWEQAFAKPELAAAAEEQGYLIGPYDSYHSIHKPGVEKWITAAFSDRSLYDDASVMKKDGEPYVGFQNVGRKLNPVLSMPAVKERVQMIMDTQVGFNSWFIDCDATGEVYDDYAPGHLTTQQEDIQARLERMAYIRDQHKMVIGSEGGHDFAADTIAFAHGIELRSFAWMDEDMKANQESEYYLGKYYNPSGGVPEHFARRVPVKEHLYAVFAEPCYDIPLYKLVYNDSVISTYHWDWSTFKIVGATNDRMLREVLYNVPPLYHLDSVEWQRYKADIVVHTTVWSDFSKRVINLEMTDFQALADDGSVQMCRYGDDITVVANFSDTGYIYEETEIPAHALLIRDSQETTLYIPQIAEENQ